MKVIIAGSRYLRDYAVVEDAVQAAFEKKGIWISEVISGHEPNGADIKGEQFAHEYGYPVSLYRADWDRYGFAAGPLRNATMARNAHALILIWDGTSRGSASMLSQAMRHNLVIYEHIITIGVRS